MNNRFSAFFLIVFVFVPAYAQGPRSHTRPAAGTVVSQSQAVDLTLTLSSVSVRPIQTWIRGAGTIDRTGRILTAYLDPRDAKFVKVGERVRTFTPATKTTMLQARVTKVTPGSDRTTVEITLTAEAPKTGST